jgi:hypothetical protein
MLCYDILGNGASTADHEYEDNSQSERHGSAAAEN